MRAPLSIYSRQIIMLIYTNKKHKYSASTVRVYKKVFITSLIRVILHSLNKGSNNLCLLLLGPQSTYRGRVEIGGVFLPSQLESVVGPLICILHYLHVFNGFLKKYILKAF